MTPDEMDELVAECEKVIKDLGEALGEETARAIIVSIARSAVRHKGDFPGIADNVDWDAIYQAADPGEELYRQCVKYATFH